MKFMKQMSIILVVSLLAEFLEYLIPLPIAASIYGLILMLIGLMTGVIRLEKVERAADGLVEIMPLMFIAPAVGIMTSVETLKSMMLPLIGACLVSTVIVMAVTGLVSQSIIRRSGQGRKRS